MRPPATGRLRKTGIHQLLCRETGNERTTGKRRRTRSAARSGSRGEGGPGARGRTPIRICIGASCIASGALEVRAGLETELEAAGFGDKAVIEEPGCLGPCSGGPVVMIDDVFYENLQPEDGGEIVREHLVKGQIVERLTHKRPDGRIVARLDDMDFFRRQTKIVLRNCGRIDPQRIEDYIAGDGYQALAKRAPAERSRRGDRDDWRSPGFAAAAAPVSPPGEVEVHPRGRRRRRSTSSATPTKATPARSWTAACWKAIRTASSKAWPSPRTRSAPSQGYVYVRAEYPLAVERLRIALEQARELRPVGQEHPGQRASTSTWRSAWAPGRSSAAKRPR